MKRVLSAVVLLFIALLPLSAANSDDDTLYGFTAAASHTERDWENKFRAIPDPKIMQRLHAEAERAPAPRGLAL